MTEKSWPIETTMCPRQRLTRDGWETRSIDIKIQFPMGNA